MTWPRRLVMTNQHFKGDYTLTMYVGSQRAPVNVIVDTGSSTFSIQQRSYEAKRDTHLQATSLVQEVAYGSGGWAGPLVRTTVGFDDASAGMLSNVAIAVDQEFGNFTPADGIFGLAYDSLNTAYDLEKRFVAEHVAPPNSYPWPLERTKVARAIAEIGARLEHCPKVTIVPGLTQFVIGQNVPNMFAFVTHRSTPSAVDAQTLNSGIFVLGGGPAEHDLFTGAFQDVAVVHDVWYNTNLIALIVAGERIPVAPLRHDQVAANTSNSIVDSGTNTLSLPKVLFDELVRAFGKIDATFATIATRAVTTKRPVFTNIDIDRRHWPDVTFVLQGTTAPEVHLTVTAAEYWQFDSFRAGNATFAIDNGGGVQSILGLPLFNPYYVVFDRANEPNGRIRFASAR